ncbi:kinase-like domain-containing protein [Dipodascopsis tothii]|uniref:kinase-like domain-containing protein n=1 Tax=Dipodascopsis tothii TaxID=44089 RepID=UPI0034CE1FC2
MFTSAIKSLSSGISASYSISHVPSFQSGPWSVFNGKKRNTGTVVSVFTFDKRKLEQALTKTIGRSSLAKRDADQICTRLRKEASYLARLRHPSILELVEPVEETRSSITFVTEHVTACLTSVIENKASGRRSDEDVDEIEIQKGLLQLAKGLEFLHESAGIVHLGLVPSAVFVNAKSDWKLSGLGLSESYREEIREYFVPEYDNRLPASLQMNIDYLAPELVLDRILDPANDLFAMGCLIHAIYCARPPIDAGHNPTTYRSGLPHALGSVQDQRLPSYLQEVLPQLLTRRPNERMSARDFQRSKYFDNILINTIRFLDAFPAKTASEKHAFMRGLNQVLPQFPKSVQQKKLLPTLLNELGQDDDLYGVVLSSVLEIGKNMSQLGFSQRILPGIRKMNKTDAGQMVILERIEIVKSRVNGKEFKEDILPVIFMAINSQSPAVQEKGLTTISAILGNVDFATIKNDMFPHVCAVFSQTKSLAVKVAALSALRGLISGGLDKYTIAEKLVPVLKAMKTREPTVIMQALGAYTFIVPMVDITCLAVDVIPHLWAMAISPLLKLTQFNEFMTLIQTASKRIEEEHGRKLGELNPNDYAVSSDPISTGDPTADFEALVLGRPTTNPSSQALPTKQSVRTAKNSRPTTKSTQPSRTSSFVPVDSSNDFDWDPMEEEPPVSLTRASTNVQSRPKSSWQSTGTGMATTSTSTITASTSQRSGVLSQQHQTHGRDRIGWATSLAPSTSFTATGTAVHQGSSIGVLQPERAPSMTSTSSNGSIAMSQSTSYNSNGFASPPTAVSPQSEFNPWAGSAIPNASVAPTTGIRPLQPPPMPRSLSGIDGGFGFPTLTPSAANGKPTNGRTGSTLDKYSSLL